MLFWIGLPLVPFLIWGWWKSMQGGTGIMWLERDRSLYLSHGGGALRVGIDNGQGKGGLSGAPAGGEVRRWEWDLEHAEDPGGFPMPGLIHEAEDERRVLLLPHWFGLLVYLLVWLGLLAVWQARKRRATAPPPG